MEPEDELTPAEKIADMIVNGNLSYPRDFLTSFASPQMVLDVVSALVYRGSMTLDMALTRVRKLVS